MVTQLEIQIEIAREQVIAAKNVIQSNITVGEFVAAGLQQLSIAKGKLQGLLNIQQQQAVIMEEPLPLPQEQVTFEGEPTILPTPETAPQNNTLRNALLIGGAIVLLA